jgi:hypothetical protein
MVETVETQESNPQLNEVLDQWIAIEEIAKSRIQEACSSSTRRQATLDAAQSHRRHLTTTTLRPSRPSNETLERTLIP